MPAIATGSAEVLCLVPGMAVAANPKTRVVEMLASIVTITLHFAIFLAFVEDRSIAGECWGLSLRLLRGGNKKLQKELD